LIRVLVVDDHSVVRAGLSQLLAVAAGIELAGVATDGAEAVQLTGREQPDVILMDLSMPVMDGVAATAAIRTQHPDVRVLVLTSFSDQARILEALRAGADGYLLKDAEPEAILQAIRSVHDGLSPLDPRAARVLLDAQRPEPEAGGATGPALTLREQEVLREVQSGSSNKQIARHLGITERTVKAHLTSIFQRLGVTDRTQAALWAAEHLR
jgi:DNA-binding NarL/FixJ family response regulator